MKTVVIISEATLDHYGLRLELEFIHYVKNAKYLLGGSLVNQVILPLRHNSHLVPLTEYKCNVRMQFEFVRILWFSRGENTSFSLELCSLSLQEATFCFREKKLQDNSLGSKYQFPINCKKKH